MKSIKILLLCMFTSLSMSAHQPDISTTMLVEQDNNVWLLQISASLTAFQQEVKMHFAETPYETPEEFQHMVLEHVKKNVQLSFNGNSDVAFGKGVVKLGHETKVVIEVLGIPSEIETSQITNTTFKDIHRSQSALIILKEGAKKVDFILNDKNGHSMSLLMTGNEISPVQTEESSRLSLPIIIALILLLSIAGLFALRAISIRNKRALISMG